MPSDPVETAHALVRERFPDAVQAWLAGSVTTGRATATSDLDVTVLLGEGEVHRESLTYDGWPVELFVHTAASVEHFVAKDLTRRRPTMARLVATGVPLLGDGGDDVRRHCQDVLDAGPPPVPAADLELRRYGLTDLLDDLEHATDPGERLVIAATLWTNAAHGALVAANHWDGTGKWLLRELRGLEENLDGDGGQGLADRWLAAHRDPAAIEAFAREVLDRLGGPLFDGYAAAAPRPDITKPA